MSNLIALDWGTTNVRAALLDGGTVVMERRGESGVGQFDSAGFQAHFAALTVGWDGPAIACGMVGSRQGWAEAPYCDLPIDTTALARNILRTEALAIVPGVAKRALDAADVMRGEETQIAGLLAQQPDFEGTIVLPGTHSKWVRVTNTGGNPRAVDFKTYMTGDIFDAFANHTILRYCVGDAPGERDGALDNSFAVAVGDVFTTNGSDWGRFFNLRAAGLLGPADAAETRERLSGTLIGMELASAARDGFDVQSATIIGSDALIDRYARAFAVLAADVETIDGARLVWPALYDIARRAGLIGD